MARRQHGLYGALVGGASGAIVLFAVSIAVGRVDSFEALRLIEATIPTLRFITSTVVTASMTVLALMLTLLGLTLSSKWRFKEVHYRRITQVTGLAVAGAMVGTLVLVSLSIPVEQVEDLQNWYAAVYYGLAVAAACLGGLVVATTILIWWTIQGLVDIGHPGGASELIESE